MSGAGQKRKQRSDKKRDIKPTVSIELKDTIYRLAYITNSPVKDVAEQICVNGVRQKKVISYMARNFRRDVRIDSSIYYGDLKRVPVSKRTAAGQSERITIRFKQPTYEVISALSYTLDCTVSRACALLLDASVRDSDFINEFVHNYLESNIDEQRMKEVKEVLKYINSDKPFNEELSWAAFLSYMIDEVKGKAEKVQDTVTDFIVNHWKEK